MKKFKPRAVFHKGFTLIEVIVSVFAFALIVVAISGLFITGLRNQRRSLAYQQLLDQTSYIAEYMGRFLRMAQKDTGGLCIVANSNYAVTRAGLGIKFKNYKDECQEFFLEGGQIKEYKAGNTLPITADNLQVNNFNIAPYGWDQTDDLQPKVTLFLEVEHKKEGVKVKVQTTISQRNLDITY